MSYLRKRKSLGSISCLRKVAILVLLKFFININEICHSIDVHNLRGHFKAATLILLNVG